MTDAPKDLIEELLRVCSGKKTLEVLDSLFQVYGAVCKQVGITPEELKSIFQDGLQLYADSFEPPKEEPKEGTDDE